MSEPGDIVILGGGTAGWMAACLFAHRLADTTARITVIESPEIGIIGVGEGSTPQLRAFFQTLGIADADWMPRCNATYKAGIGFHGWSRVAGFEHYFHPFPTSLDQQTEPAFFANARARRLGADAWAHPDRYYLPARLAAERRAPLTPPDADFEVGYGYHFDAYLVGAMLRDEAVKRGVRHLERRVTGVQVDAHGKVVALDIADDAPVIGDLFVDCSGFRSVIAQEALGTRFLSFASNLFNDSAVVMPTPADSAGINSQTKATALSAGWAWDIPLTNRTGNGYVYSSRYIDRDAAEAELRAHLRLTDSDAAVRHLTMKVGRVEHSWASNCLALGLAQGFLEPLEATALHIVQTTVEAFLDAWRVGGFSPRHRDAFNASIAARYEGIRDYIVCHYRVNQRDGVYWRDAAAITDLSDSLKGVLTAWFSGGDLVEEIERQGIARYYAPLSWHCLLAGYGQLPDRARMVRRLDDVPVPDLAAIDAFIAETAANFPRHEAALAALRGERVTT